MLERAAGDDSISKQATKLIEAALSWPEWPDKQDMHGWNGTHHFGLGRLSGHAAERLEAARGFQPPFGSGRRWSDDLAATESLRVIIDKLLDEHARRLGGQLSPEEATRARALGSEIGLCIIMDLDEYQLSRDPQDPDDAIIDGNAPHILPRVARDLGWKLKNGGDK
jgi:hypothetical protein